MENAKMVSDAIRWRRTYYRFIIILFFVCIIAFAILLILTPKTKNQDCLSGFGSCIFYENDKSCIPTSRTNGGTNCTTICASTTRSFICACPSNRIWSQEDLSCKLKCSVNITTTNCVDYPDGEQCLLTTDMYNGTVCYTKCNASGGYDFICLCNEGLFWNPDEHFCQICPFGYTLAFNNTSCIKLVSTKWISYNESVNLCNAARTHLPIITSWAMIHELQKFMKSNGVDFVWLALEFIDKVWYWHAPCYNTFTRLATFYGSTTWLSGQPYYHCLLDADNKIGWEYYNEGGDDGNMVVCQYDIP